MKIILDNDKNEEQAECYYFEMTSKEDCYEDFPLIELFDFLMERTESIYFSHKLLTEDDLLSLNPTEYLGRMDNPLKSYKHFVGNGDLKRDTVISKYGMPDGMYSTNLYECINWFSPTIVYMYSELTNRFYDVLKTYDLFGINPS